MTRPAELFAIEAIIVVIVGLLFRAPVMMAVHLRGQRGGFTVPTDTVALVIAACFCFFAAAYSFSMLSMSMKAAYWHFWLTTVFVGLWWAAWVGIGSRFPANGVVSPWQAVILYTWSLSVLCLISTQLIFAVSFLKAIFRFWRLTS